MKFVLAEKPSVAQNIANVKMGIWKEMDFWFRGAMDI